jgi:hypothetical protein
LIATLTTVGISTQHGVAFIGKNPSYITTTIPVYGIKNIIESPCIAEIRST